MEAFGLDELFRSAVGEYAVFRRFYEDGQLPLMSTQAPSDMEKTAYQEVLVSRLGARLGRRGTLPLRRHVDGSEARLVIELAGRAAPTAPVAAEPPGGEYAWSTRVDFDAAAGVVTLIKPLTRAAWTMERAYSDAERVTAEILVA